MTGVLTPEQYAEALRSAHEPFVEAASPLQDAVRTRSGFEPTAADVGWDTYRTDGAWHRTYWVSQWPRLPVGPLFLTPLLLGSRTLHTVSVIVEPIAPARSRRAVEAAITTDEADAEVRERRGFRTTARRRHLEDATVRREEELAAGHEEIRFAGYVTVTGRTEAELDDACERIQQSSQQSYLDLRPLWGEQQSGFVFGALPAGRGLRSNRTGGLL